MKPELRQAMVVFNKVLKHGDRYEDGYRLDGLSATSEQDGYTIVLKDDAVSLRIFFHNTVDLKYDDRKALANFKRRMRSIERNCYAGAGIGE